MSILIDRIKTSFIYLFLKEHYLKWRVSKNPEAEVDRRYFHSFHKHCNLKNPKDYIEKIYWLELYSDTSLWSLCADKYRIREYVGKLGLLQYMPTLYGHWDSVSNIDFEKIPNSFVIKANNGSGTVKVVKDKSKTNLNRLKRTLRRWLVLPFGYVSAQLHYTRIKPCILAEEILHNDYIDLSPDSLVDFKVYCINGEPQFIWIPYNRVNGHVHMQTYDITWNPKPEYMKNIAHYVYYESDALIPKPACLDEMLDIARKLSACFPQVRVDFYIANGKPIIGEMTFTQGYGFLTDKVYNDLGSMMDLSKVM